MRVNVCPLPGLYELAVEQDAGVGIEKDLEPAAELVCRVGVGQEVAPFRGWSVGSYQARAKRRRRLWDG